MLRKFLDKLRQLDWIMLVAILLLISLGLAAIYSVDLSQSDQNFSNSKKQVVFCFVGLILFFAFSVSNYSALRVYSQFILVGILILLIAVLFFGSTIRGTRGWFQFFGLGFQPVELAKIGLIVVLAKFFSNRLHQFKISKHLIVSLFFTLLFVIPTLLQPDLGSSILLFGLWFGLISLIGLPKKYFILLLAIFLIVSLLSWTLVLQEYQKDRILTFLNPTADPLGSGYNVSQSIIAIGSGFLWGRGLGFGSQSQLKFIPESQTDFIFAVIAEELGLFGVALVLGLWLIIFYRLGHIARRAKDDFGLFLVLGITIIFFLHLLVNVGMNMGIMPVTGISLPFLSYGGSFLIISLAMMGIAESVAIKR